jgi:uncharacterized membrane protein
MRLCRIILLCKYDINNNERYVIRTYIWDVRVTKGISYWRVKSHLAPHSNPVFFNHPVLFVLWLVESSIIFQVIDYIARSSFVTLFLTNNGVRRPSVLWTTTGQHEVLIVALGVHVVVVLTRTTFVNDEDAVVDVEVDRCIDEISASNLS